MNKSTESDHSDHNKENWITPKITELDIKSTETNAGPGADGGSFGNTAS